MTEPSSAEVMRRLDEVVRQVQGLVAQVQASTDKADQTYVRKDVQDQKNLSVDNRVQKLENNEDEREKTAAATRRQLMFLILAIAIPAIGSLLLSVNGFLNAAGK